MKFYLASNIMQVIEKINFENKKRVAFISNAADVYEDKYFVENDREALKSKNLEIINFDLREKTKESITKELSRFEIIFVSGGNSFYLLEQVKKSGFDRALFELKEKDMIYLGSSAGSSILSPNLEFISTLDSPEKSNLTNHDAIHLFDFYILPHYKKERYNEKIEKILKEYSHLNIVPIRDDQLIFVSKEIEYKIL